VEPGARPGPGAGALRRAGSAGRAPGLAGDQGQLGFLDSTDTYVELDQGDLQGPDLVADKTRKGLPDGQSAVQGQLWERRISEDERTRSLVLASPALTTIVTGDLPYGDLESFAATLAAD
jgi:hypothetical protein